MFELMRKSFQLVKRLIHLVWKKNDKTVRANMIGFSVIYPASVLVKTLQPIVLYRAIDKAARSNSFDPVPFALQLGGLWMLERLATHATDWLYFNFFDDACQIISDELVDSIIEMDYEKRSDQDNIASINTAIERLDRTLHTFLYSGVLNISGTLFQIGATSIIVAKEFGVEYALLLISAFIASAQYTKYELPGWKEVNNDFLSKRKKAQNDSFDKLLKVNLIDELGVKKQVSNELHEHYAQKREACKNLAISTNKVLIGQSLLLSTFLIGSCLALAYTRPGESNSIKLSKLLTLLIAVFTEIGNVGMRSTQIIGRYIPVLEEILGLIQKPELDCCDELGSSLLRLTGQKFTNPAISFMDVGFCYSSRKDSPILNHLSFVIEPNRFTAMVGQSGQGKSTIANLLLSRYQAYSGEIVLSDQDETTEFREIPQAQLRRSIGFVSQKPILFNCSIYKNLTYGLPTVSRERVEQVIVECGIDGLINRLPKGLETVVGEKGVDFSGGEKQLIALARVILRDPAVFILDEPTSSIDAVNLKRVERVLEKVCQNKTTFLITHRLSLAMKADRIYVLDRGKIFEQGSHQELMAIEDGLYSKMYQAQNSPGLFKAPGRVAEAERMTPCLGEGDSTRLTLLGKQYE